MLNPVDPLCHFLKKMNLKKKVCTEDCTVIQHFKKIPYLFTSEFLNPLVVCSLLL